MDKLKSFWKEFNRLKNKYYTWTNVGYVAFFVVMFAFMYSIIGHAFNHIEAQECERWIRDDLIEHEWQEMQCEHHGIEIN